MKRILFCAGLGLLLAVIGCSEKLQVPTEPTPPDTVTVHDTSVVHDTIILTEYDTTIVTVIVHDTTYLPGDTVWQWIYDTTFVIDTLVLIDTVLVPYIVYDTVLIYQTDTLFLPPDTIYVSVVDTLVDTVYVPLGALMDTACWSIDWQHLSATVQLRNPAGWYRVIGFDRLRKDLPPDDKAFSITAGGQEFYFSVAGRKYLIEWVGGDGVYLEENAYVTIRLRTPEYIGKVTGTQCHYYLEGQYWWLIPLGT